MKRENLEQFQGKENITKITSDNGVVSYLTQSRSFGDEAYAKGAIGLATVENEKKHVLFLFNSDEKEVGRYYIGKKLRGKTPEQLIKIKERLVFFESWNPEQAKWVPCVGTISSIPVTQPHVSIRKELKPPFPPEKESIETKPIFEYTEDMFREELARQEKKDLLEYGTTDEKEIERIKKGKKENTKFYIILVIIVFIVPILFMGMIQKCTGSNYNPLEDNTPWEPRHTQIFKPAHNTNHEITIEGLGIPMPGNEIYRV